MDNQYPNIERTESLLVKANGGEEPPKRAGRQKCCSALFFKT